MTSGAVGHQHPVVVFIVGQRFKPDFKALTMSAIGPRAAGSDQATCRRRRSPRTIGFDGFPVRPAGRPTTRRPGFIDCHGMSLNLAADRLSTMKRLINADGREHPQDRPSPYSPSWTPRAAQFGTGIRHNVAVPMSDNVVLRADIHYPTVPETGQAAAGPFPVLLSVTPYGKKAPPPAAQIGGGATPFFIERGYIEVMVDVRVPAPPMAPSRCSGPGNHKTGWSW